MPRGRFALPDGSIAGTSVADADVAGVDVAECGRRRLRGLIAGDTRGVLISRVARGRGEGVVTPPELDCPPWPSLIASGLSWCNWWALMSMTAEAPLSGVTGATGGPWLRAQKLVRPTILDDVAARCRGARYGGYVGPGGSGDLDGVAGPANPWPRTAGES